MDRTSLKRLSIGVFAGLMLTLGAAAPASASAAGADSVTAVTAAKEARAAQVTKTAAKPNSADAYCTGRRVLDCWVHEPIVTEAKHTYFQIQFLPGDHVTLDAGGCVQTGGSGKTWKRYVNPASDNGLYHGSIQIPGAMDGLAELWTVVGHSFDVGGDGGSLVLGYQDDGYSDNGYWGHDDGTGDQCKNSVNAWVHLTIS